jgi:hypothetical protein
MWGVALSCRNPFSVSQAINASSVEKQKHNIYNTYKLRIEKKKKKNIEKRRRKWVPP